jgi:hypothetical protein
MFPRWKYSLFQSWFRRTVAFQKPLAFLSKIINCFTNIFDSKQLKYSPKVYIFVLRRENGNSRRNELLFLVSVDKLPACWQLSRENLDQWNRAIFPSCLRKQVGNLSTHALQFARFKRKRLGASKYSKYSNLIFEYSILIYQPLPKWRLISGEDIAPPKLGFHNEFWKFPNIRIIFLYSKC